MLALSPRRCYGECARWRLAHYPEPFMRRAAANAPQLRAVNLVQSFIIRIAMMDLLTSLWTDEASRGEDE